MEPLAAEFPGFVRLPRMPILHRTVLPLTQMVALRSYTYGGLGIMAGVSFMMPPWELGSLQIVDDLKHPNRAPLNSLEPSQLFEQIGFIKSQIFPPIAEPLDVNAALGAIARRPLAEDGPVGLRYFRALSCAWLDDDRGLRAWAATVAAGTHIAPEYLATMRSTLDSLLVLDSVARRERMLEMATASKSSLESG